MPIIQLVARCPAFLSLMLLSLVMFGVTTAEAQVTRDKIIEHLEFLGYTSEKVDQGIKATHPTKFGFVLVELLDGLIIQSVFAGVPLDQNDAARLTAVNTLTTSAAVARFFWASSGELAMRAWFPGGYEKARFTPFIEAWEQDSLTIRTTYETLKPYLK
ncbi:MAG: hypothetical protein GKS05_08770 [Nitrospirales bacterium]|nr:hypothetical protein [Nitrospirales bacterium]